MPGRRLAFEERTEIRRRLADEETYREIGAALGRPASTIQREVERNGGRGDYHPWFAQARWKQTRKRPKPFKLEGSGPLTPAVAAEMLTKGLNVAECSVTIRTYVRARRVGGDASAAG